MGLFILRRIGVALMLVWLVATLIFAILRAVPGDPAELLLSSGGVAPDPAQVEELREQLGLNDPLLTQYARYIGGVARGDLGSSIQDGHSVAEEISLRLPRTLELIAAAAFLSLLIGLPTGVLAALHVNRPIDRVLSVVASIFLSVPVFVVGTIAILVLSQQLKIAPAGGFVPFSQKPLEHLILLAMPAGTIAVGLAAVVFRTTRTAMLELLGRDFVRALHAKGVKRRRIVVRHVLRNALIPIVTAFALQIGTLLGGTVLVEYVFNWPGLSGYLVRSVEARDYPEVVGIVLVISTLFVFLNLVVDLLYAALDPRVRLSR